MHVTVQPSDIAVVVQLKLSKLLAAVRLHGLDMDSDELECILANLIYKGFIKGYLAHGNSLVVSKTSAFPPFAQCVATALRR